MGKNKKNSNNTPRRKRWNRKVRLPNAKEWIKTYEGKNIIKGYSRWYGVDRQCAITELEMLGIMISEKEKAKVQQAIAAKKAYKKRMKEQNEQRKQEKQMWDDESDETFAFIAGYTSGGIPFGITHEEMEEREKPRQQKPNKTEKSIGEVRDDKSTPNHNRLNDRDLPF